MPDSVRLRIAGVYALAGMTASGVITGFLFGWGGLKGSPLAIFTFWYTYCWPIVPTLAAVLVVPLRKALFVLVIYALAGMVIVCVWSVMAHVMAGDIDVKPLLNAGRFAAALFITAADVYLIILITGNRRLRAVCAPVLASLMLFGFTTLASRESWVVAYDQPWVPHGMVAKLGPDSWYMLMAVPAGWVCWHILKWLKRRFSAKSFSDVQLLVDTWWLIVTFSACVELSVTMGWFGLAGLTAFVVYRSVVTVGLRLWPIDVRLPPGRRLLLLRVFGFQQRTEQLFDAVALRWRFEGCATMIGAADLAMRTISLERLVSFLSGRLDEEFVRDESDLSAKLRYIDERRDPDGRFRIAEFFCFDSSWHATLKALLKRTDVVLMDLRSFSRSNLGCLFELQQLVESKSLSKTIFVVDDATDVQLLHATLAQAQTTDPGSSVAGTPASYQVEHGARTVAEQDRLYQALCRVASGFASGPAAEPA
jgi:hypothetical protein